jgi:hypothetical protein
MTTNTVRIPRVFYIDHRERDLPTPTAIGETSRHVIIDRADPALSELIDDARHYADKHATDAPGWLKNAARELLKVLGP